MKRFLLLIVMFASVKLYSQTDLNEVNITAVKNNGKKIVEIYAHHKDYLYTIYDVSLYHSYKTFDYKLIYDHRYSTSLEKTDTILNLYAMFLAKDIMEIHNDITKNILTFKSIETQFDYNLGASITRVLELNSNDTYYIIANFEKVIIYDMKSNNYIVGYRKCEDNIKIKSLKS